MPYEDAERSMRLFAREVMPALQKLSGNTPVRGRVADGSPTGAPVNVGLLGS
jgi:hypothetical protein